MKKYQPYLDWKSALYFIDEGYKITRECYSLKSNIIYLYKNTEKDDVIYAVYKISKGVYNEKPWDPENDEFLENDYVLIDL